MCRSTPVPLSVIWKVADQIRQKRVKDLEKFMKETELSLMPVKDEYVKDDLYDGVYD